MVEEIANDSINLPVRIELVSNNNNNQISLDFVCDGQFSNIEIDYINLRYGDSIISVLKAQSDMSISAIDDVDKTYLWKVIDNIKMRLLDLLQIDFYKSECLMQYDFYHGFLGKINNITINTSAREFIFGNGFNFSLNCFDPDNTYDIAQSANFNIFINRFLPFLLEENRFSKVQSEKIEEFILNFK